MSNIWSDDYNKLPYEIRLMGSAHECSLRIQHLKFEKDRLKKRYEQSVAEINSHIKNCERGLKDVEKEIVALKTQQKETEE